MRSILVTALLSLQVAKFCAASSVVVGNWVNRDDFVVADDQLVHGERTHELVFAVKQLNLDMIERILDEVSNPASSKYGHHLSRDAVHNLTANAEATIAIRDFCEKKGLQVSWLAAPLVRMGACSKKNSP
jgi:hypothetical protein